VSATMCAYSYIFSHRFLGLKPPGNTKRQTQMQCHDKMPSLMCNNKIAPNAANEETQLIASCTSPASFNHRTSGGATSAAAAAISLFIPFADSSSRGRPSVDHGSANRVFSMTYMSRMCSHYLPNSRLHHMGGSNGLDPPCSGGYTSLKKYQTCPITTPMISSFGTVPCITKLTPISTHGRYGARKTSRPRKLMRVSGLRRDHMYTSVEDKGWPRKGMDTKGDRSNRLVMA
jgi:hypothetical protein